MMQAPSVHQACMDALIRMQGYDLLSTVGAADKTIISNPSDTGFLLKQKKPFSSREEHLPFKSPQQAARALHFFCKKKKTTTTT